MILYCLSIIFTPDLAFETIHMEFKSLVMSLSPHEIVMDALEYQLIPHKIENLPSFTSVLQLLNESPEHILAIHSLTPSEENNVVSQPKKDRRGCVVM